MLRFALGAILATAQTNIEWKSCWYSGDSCGTETSCTQTVVLNMDCATYQAQISATMGCQGWWGTSSQYICTEFAQVTTTITQYTYSSLSDCTSGSASSTSTESSTLACEPASETGARYTYEQSTYGMNQWNECTDLNWSGAVYKFTCTDDTATADNPAKPITAGCVPCQANAGTASDCNDMVTEYQCENVGSGTGTSQSCYYWGDDAYDQYYATGCPNYDENCVPCRGNTINTDGSTYAPDATCNAIYDEQACGDGSVPCTWEGFQWGDNCAMSDAIEGFFENIALVITIIVVVFCVCIICVFCMCCGGAVMCGLAAAKKGEADGKASGQVSGV